MTRLCLVGYSLLALFAAFLWTLGLLVSFIVAAALLAALVNKFYGFAAAQRDVHHGPPRAPARPKN
jgi:hypothetical protein